MTRPNLSNLTAEQERVLCDAFRYIRRRATWLRAQKEASPKENEAEDTLVETRGTTLAIPMHT